MHTNHLLKKKRGETGAVCKYEARLVVRRKQVVDWQEDMFSQKAQYEVFDLIVCAPLLQGWTPTRINFENTFVSWQLERLEYREMPSQVSLAIKEKVKTFSVKTSIYGLKDGVWV